MISVSFWGEGEVSFDPCKKQKLEVTFLITSISKATKAFLCLINRSAMSSRSSCEKESLVVIPFESVKMAETYDFLSLCSGQMTAASSRSNHDGHRGHHIPLVAGILQLIVP